MSNTEKLVASAAVKFVGMFLSAVIVLAPLWFLFDWYIKSTISLTDLDKGFICGLWFGMCGCFVGDTLYSVTMVLCGKKP